LTDWSKIESKSTCKTINEFLNIPADTRPGLSASGLWFHLSMTSAFATSILLSYELKKRETEDIDGELMKNFVYLRFAALFHDIGKPIDRRNHVKMSIKFVKEIFHGLISNEVLDEVCEIISQHHKKEVYKPEYAHYLKDADRAVSGIDRLSEVLRKIMEKDFSWVNDEFNNWEAWSRLSETEFKRISHEYIKKLQKKESKSSGNRKITIIKGEDRLALVRCEARAIQQMIRSNKLDEMKGSSMLVSTGFLDDQYLSFSNDYTSWRKFVNNLLPLENIIFAGGGNIVFLSDVFRAKKIQKIIEDGFLNHVYQKTDVIGDCIYFPLDEIDVGMLYRKLLAKIASKKNDLLTTKPQILSFGYGKLCESCMERPATKIIPVIGSAYCTTCYNVFMYGKKHGFKKILQEFKKKDSFPMNWVENDTVKVQLSEYILEFIAGHSIEDITKFHKYDNFKLGRTSQNPSNNLQDVPRRRDFCIISADGNMMGEFCSHISSMNELAERSAKIRQIMDRSFYDVTNIVFETIKNSEFGYTEPEKEASLTRLRLEFGKMICAGDDILLIVPGYLGIPFSLLLGEYFHRHMGESVSLSFGLVTADVKKPLRKVFDFAENIQKNHSKEESRGIEQLIMVLDYHKFEDSNVSHDIISDSSGASFRLNYRPIIYCKSSKESFFDFLSNTIGSTVSDAKGLVEYTIHLQSEITNKNAEIIKSYERSRNSIRATIQSVRFDDTDLFSQILNMQVFVLNKNAKESKRKENSLYKEYSRILKLVSEKDILDTNNRTVIQIFDSYLLLQMLGGGVI